MMLGYILEDDHTTRPAKTEKECLAQHARWRDAGTFKKGHPKVVDKTEVEGAGVSTVFLGIDHSFTLNDTSPPILFETMIFGGEHSDYCRRYETWDEAQKGHNEIVKALKEGTFDGQDFV